MTIRSTLKRAHHKLLVWHMLRKPYSWFGNAIHEIDGVIKTNQENKVNPSFREKKIAVIVLNRNNKDIICSCIDSLIKFNAYRYEIVVVDNLSTDGSYELMEEKYKDKITLMRNSTNGCSTGRNLGAKLTSAEYLLFLDSDQGPTRYGWLDTYLFIMRLNKEIGAVGYAGGFFTQRDMTGPTFEYYPEKALPKKYLFRTNVDYLCTSGVLVRKSVFEEIGGFDPAYDPHCFEDADLSRRIIDAGYKIAYSKDFPVYHEAHATTKANEKREDYLTLYKKNADHFRKMWPSKTV